MNLTQALQLATFAVAILGLGAFALWRDRHEYLEHLREEELKRKADPRQKYLFEDNESAHALTGTR
jgi:hypothetical protein